MRRRPPTATKPMPVPGALVIATAIPPSKTNTPTTAIVGRLTYRSLARGRQPGRAAACGCSRHCIPRLASFIQMHFLGQKHPYDATGSIRPDFHDSRLSVG